MRKPNSPSYLIPMHPLLRTFLLFLGELLACILFGLASFLLVSYLGQPFAPKDPTAGLGGLIFLYYWGIYSYSLGVWVGDALYNSWFRRQDALWLPLLGIVLAILLTKALIISDKGLPGQGSWALSLGFPPMFAMLTSWLGRIRTPLKAG